MLNANEPNTRKNYGHGPCPWAQQVSLYMYCWHLRSSSPGCSTSPSSSLLWPVKEQRLAQVLRLQHSTGRTGTNSWLLISSAVAAVATGGVNQYIKDSLPPSSFSNSTFPIKMIKKKKKMDPTGRCIPLKCWINIQNTNIEYRTAIL